MVRTELREAGGVGESIPPQSDPENDDEFSNKLSELGDIYINDAFGTAHRSHASNVGTANLFNSNQKGYGYLIKDEIKYLKNYVEKIYKKNDPAHDFEHIMRVYRNAERICQSEKANKKLVLISVLLHDIVKLKEPYSRFLSSSDASAEKSLKILKKLKLDEKDIDIISEAIINHSFTKKKISNTIEGQILQDADRLDEIGRASCRERV